MSKKECTKVRRAMLLGCLLPWSAVDENDNSLIAVKERPSHLTSNCPLLLNPSVMSNSSTKSFQPNSNVPSRITTETQLGRPIQSRPKSAPTGGSREFNKDIHGGSGKIEIKSDKNGKIATNLLPLILKVEKDDSKTTETVFRITYGKRPPELKDDQSTTTITDEPAKEKPGPCRLKPCLKQPCPSSPIVTGGQQCANTDQKDKADEKAGASKNACISSSNTVLKISCPPKKAQEPPKLLEGKSKYDEEALESKSRGPPKNLTIIMEELGSSNGKIKSTLFIKFDENGKGLSELPADGVFTILEAQKNEGVSDTVVTIKYFTKASSIVDAPSSGVGVPDGVAPSISQVNDDEDYIEPSSNLKNEGQTVKDDSADDSEDFYSQDGENYEGEKEEDYDDDYEDVYYDDDEVTNTALIKTKANQAVYMKHLTRNVPETRYKTCGSVVEQRKRGNYPSILGATSVFQEDRPQKRTTNRKMRKSTESEESSSKRPKKFNFRVTGPRPKSPITNVLVNKTRSFRPPVHTLFGLKTLASQNMQSRPRKMDNTSPCNSQKIILLYKETQV